MSGAYDTEGWPVAAQEQPKRRKSEGAGGARLPNWDAKLQIAVRQAEGRMENLWANEVERREEALQKLEAEMGRLYLRCILWSAFFSLAAVTVWAATRAVTR